MRRFWLVLVMVGTIALGHAQTYTVLYNFGSKSGDPLFPDSGIIAQGRDGNLYSTTPYGGAGGGFGNGTVFRITPAATLSVINQLQSRSDSGLTLGTDGNFYGIGDGGIFKITRNGSLNILFNGFSNTPSPPIQAIDGNFYGTAGEVIGTVYTVYKFTPSGAFTTLHTFDNTDGINPYSPLVQGTDGTFYGTAANGGTDHVGTVFRITPSGKFTLLFTFPTAGLTF